MKVYVSVCAYREVLCFLTLPRYTWLQFQTVIVIMKGVFFVFSHNSVTCIT